MLLTRIQESASRYPEKTAIQVKEAAGYRKLTYRELLAAVSSVARGLGDAGVAKGDRVAILSENRPEWIIAYLAVAGLGAVVVPLDAQLADREVAVLLADAGAKAVCCSSATRQKIPAGGDLTVISFDAGDGVSLREMMGRHPDAALPPAPAAGDLAAVLYTSGTTGDPKGVMLSHGNLAANCAGATELHIITPEDNLLCLLPLHHTYPAMVCMLLPLSLGATVTMLNSLKGPDIIACMQEAGVSVLAGVPQLLAGLRRAIVDQIERSPLPLRLAAKLFLSLSGLVRSVAGINIGTALFAKVHARFGSRFRLMASGGARLDPEVYRDLSSLGFPVIEGYGLTETSPVCTFNPIGRQKAGSIGMQLPGVEVRIAEPDGQGQGEIVVRGPNVMPGYYRKPEATAEVIRDGWFHTGDLGYRDRDGYFFLTGRSKEMIVLATGKKIFPDELETFYKQLPCIKEICLVQTDRGLEAAVVPDFDYLRRMNIANAQATISFEIEDLQKDLPPYRRVRGVKIFKESLPVTRLGKLRRMKVRDLYLAGGERFEKAVQDEDRELLETSAGQRVAACLAPFSAKRSVVPDDNLEIDLGLDSLSRLEFIVSLERSFGLDLPDAFGSEVFTVRDVVLKLQSLLDAGPAPAGSQVRLTWAEILAQEPSEGAKAVVRLDRNLLCLWAWSAARWCINVFLLFYGRRTVRGVGNLPAQGPYLITPNHLSNADAFVLGTAMPASIARKAFFLGDTRFFGGPVSSRIAPLVQVIPVDMETKLSSAMQLSAYVLRQGRVLCVFPEGSRSRDGKIKPFKKGVGILAKELNVPLVPVAIDGTYEMMRPGRLVPRPGRVTVTFGRPVHPEGLTYEKIVEQLQAEVVKMLEVT
jgi:long-chain acyl-CoA synthetase